MEIEIVWSREIELARKRIEHRCAENTDFLIIDLVEEVEKLRAQLVDALAEAAKDLKQ